MERLLFYGRKFLVLFTAVFTCLILASAVFIGIYSNPYLPFKLIAQAIIVSAASALLNFIYYSEKPIHKRSMVLRTALHFCLMLLTVTGCAWQFQWLLFTNMLSTVTFFLLFLLVYAVIWLCSFLGDLLNERTLNAGLAKYRTKERAGQL